MYSWPFAYISIALLFTKFDTGYSVIRGKSRKSFIHKSHAFMLNMLCQSFSISGLAH